MNPFTILGISNRSTAGDVKSGYRELALKYHPDKVGREATARFREINAACETIIEEKLYYRPEKLAEHKTDRRTGSTSSNGAGSDCRCRPQRHPLHQRPTQASTRPRSPPQPPRSPARPTAQPPPRPLSPTTDDPSLGNFVKIYNILYVFIVFNVLFLFSFGCRRGWKETHQCFREFKNLLRNRASSFRLNSQLDVLVYIVKMVWANNLDTDPAKFVRGYSCAAMMSVMQTIEYVPITERLLRVAENAFLGEQAALYCRILSNISNYLEEDRRDYPDMRYSSRGKVVAYKLAIQLKYTKMSNEAEVSSKWLAVDVGNINAELEDPASEPLLLG